MWASSAATEIMKTPRSSSTEISTRSRRALKVAPPYPTLTPLERGKCRLRSPRGPPQEVGAGVGAVQRFGQLLGCLLLLLGQLRRHVDLEPVANIAAAIAAWLRRALTAQALNRPVPGASWDLDLLGSVQGRYLDRRPAQRLGDRDRHGHLEVAAVEPLEHRGRGDPGGHVEVAGRATAGAGLAFAGKADPRSVLDPGRDVDLVALRLPGQAGAAAGGAGVLDDLPGAAALGAGLADREEALALRVDAAAFAARAGDRGGARRGAAAMAGRAALGLWHGDTDLGAIDRLVEAEADLGFEVAAALLFGLRPAASAAAKDAGEDVAEVAAAEPTPGAAEGLAATGSPG